MLNKFKVMLAWNLGLIRKMLHRIELKKKSGWTIHASPYWAGPKAGCLERKTLIGCLQLTLPNLPKLSCSLRLCLWRRRMALFTSAATEGIWTQWRLVNHIWQRVRTDVSIYEKMEQYSWRETPKAVSSKSKLLERSGTIQHLHPITANLASKSCCLNKMTLGWFHGLWTFYSLKLHFWSHWFIWKVSQYFWEFWTITSIISKKY